MLDTIIGDTQLKIDTKDNIIRVQLMAKNPKTKEHPGFTWKFNDEDRRKLLHILIDYKI